MNKLGGKSRPIILTAINLILLAFILYFLWLYFLPRFKYSGMYMEITVAVTMISIAFGIAIGISIYMAWRAYRKSTKGSITEGEISL